MSAYWNSASNKFLVFVLLTFSLLGCKTTTPISNGQNIADLSGKAGNDAMFSVTVPENINGLLIEVAGSPDISLDLLDADKNSLGACVSATRCLLDHPSAAKYLIKLSATADYAGVNISASWGGPDEASLYNNVEITELAGNEQSLLLKSLYVGLNNGPVSFTTTGLNGATLEVADQYGDTLHTCESAESCAVNGLSEGLFFARILGAAEFTEGTLKASWGNPVDTTLRNGVKKAVSGNYGDVVLESLYLPTGASAIMAHANNHSIELEILDSEGTEIGQCNGEACHASGLTTGLYFIRASFQENALTSSIMASWAGIGVHSMRNGDYLSNMTLAGGELLTRSFYVNEAGAHVLFIPSENANLVSIYTESGDFITGCGMSVPCSFQAPAAGAYFALVQNDFPETQTFGLSVAWATPTEATLHNGSQLSPLSLNSMDNLVQSIYVDEAGSDVMVMGSGDFGDIIIYSDSGDDITICRMSTPCTFEAPYAGTYFSVVSNLFGPSNLTFSLSAAWASPANASLSNGDQISGLSLQPEETLIQSFYVGEATSNVMVMSSDQPGHLLIFSDMGDDITGCQMGLPCAFEAPYAGTYFVVALNQYPEPLNFSLSVAWGSPTTASLTNGGQISGLNLQPQETLIQSFYVAEATSKVMVISSDQPGHLLIFSDMGDDITGCQMGLPCAFEAPYAGTYFVVALNQYPEPLNFSLSVAWGSPTTASLTNGGQISGLNLQPQETLIKSFYVAKATSKVMVISSDQPGHLLIFSDMGNDITGCQMGLPCAFEAPYAGTYFVVALNQYPEPLNFSLSVAWGSPTTASLTNGGQISGLNLQPQETLIKSFYVAEATSKVMVISSDQPGHLLIFSDMGDDITGCQMGLPCAFEAPYAGTYFAVALNQYPEPLNFSLSVAWGSTNNFTLENNAPLTLSGSETDIGMESLYLSEPGDMDIIIAGSVEAILYSFDGGDINACIDTCTITGLPSGNYFIGLRYLQSTNNASLQVSW